MKMRQEKKIIDRERLETALFHYGKQTWLQGSGHFRLCCPWHDDNDPTCTVFTDRGIFYCFSCHADKAKGQRGVPLEKGLAALGVPPEDIRAIIRTASTKDLYEAETFNPWLAESLEAQPKKKLVISDRRCWPTNWSFRGVRPDFLAKFDANLATLDHEPLPRLELFLPKRGPAIYLRLSTTVQPKTWNDYDLFTKATMPFGTLPLDWKLPRDAIGIVIVEGAFDALKMAQHIYDRFGSLTKLPVVALLGSPGWPTFFKDKFMTHLLDQFSRISLKVFLALDSDDAGEKMANTILTDLVLKGWYLQRRQVIRIRFPRSVSDPGDLSYDQFLSALVPQFLEEQK